MFGIYLGIGIIAGLLSGLLGIGGGLIVVPGLLFAFSLQDIPQYLNMHLAVGSSLASISLTNLVSIYAHHKYGAINWKATLLLSPGLMLGGFSGALLAGFLPAQILRITFSVFVFIAATQIGIGVFNSIPNRQLPGIFISSIIGLVIGAISALLGIGGGSIIVPYLVWHNVPIRQAVATAAACGLPPALASALGYLISGWNVAALPTYSSGFIYWPAFIGIVLTSTLFARIGAKLAHQLPTLLLRRIFAVFLYIIGIYMLGDYAN